MILIGFYQPNDALNKVYLGEYLGSIEYKSWFVFQVNGLKEVILIGFYQPNDALNKVYLGEY